MLSNQLGELLRASRRQLGMSRAELARRARVSVRLVAELERGQRPNVSLESAMRLLSIAGVSVVASAPDGTSAEVRGPGSAERERAARVERRRKTWTGRHVSLRDQDDELYLPRSNSERLLAVDRVSKQAYGVASSKRMKTVPATRKKATR